MDGNETKHSVGYVLEETWLTKAPRQNHKTTEKIHYKDPATKHSQRSFIQVTEPTHCGPTHTLAGDFDAVPVFL